MFRLLKHKHKWLAMSYHVCLTSSSISSLVTHYIAIASSFVHNLPWCHYTLRLSRIYFHRNVSYIYIYRRSWGLRNLIGPVYLGSFVVNPYQISLPPLHSLHYYYCYYPGLLSISLNPCSFGIMKQKYLNKKRNIPGTSLYWTGKKYSRYIPILILNRTGNKIF